LIKLAAAGGVETADSVVVEITGSGLKDSQIAMRGIAEIPLIEPSIEELERVLRI